MRITFHRRAFSRTELLVLAALVGTTFAFVAPAALRGRMQAQRVECKPAHLGMFDDGMESAFPILSLPGNDWEEDYWVPPFDTTTPSDDGPLASQVLAWLAEADIRASHSAPVRILRGCNHKFHPTGRCGGRALPFDSKQTHAGLSMDRPFLP